MLALFFSFTLSQFYSYCCPHPLPRFSLAPHFLPRSSKNLPEAVCHAPTLQNYWSIGKIIIKSNRDRIRGRGRSRGQPEVKIRSRLPSLTGSLSAWGCHVLRDLSPLRSYFRAWLLCQAKTSDHFVCFKRLSIFHCYQSMSNLDFKSSCSRHERKWKWQTRAQLVCKETCLTLKETEAFLIPL